MLVKIPRKDTATVVAALAHIGKLPEELRRSLTTRDLKEASVARRSGMTSLARSHFV